MNNEPQPLTLAMRVKHTLVKWDGEPPEGAEPIGHPQCIEVIELEDGVSRVIYRREQ